MAITPLDIRKMDFTRKMRGFDPEEVGPFLDLVAEALTEKLGDVSRLEQENRWLTQRLEDAQRRQKELQDSLLHAQKISKEITDSARREAELLMREAQVTADDMVAQAIERANQVEAKILELRTLRRELQVKLKTSLDLYQRVLAADIEEEQSTAVIRTLRRRPATGQAS
jgi:cell division initiation protein